MIVMKADEDEPIFLRIGMSEWTKVPDFLEEGEYCYDHESNAFFERGEGFDWEEFNKTMGGVGSREQIETMERYFSIKAEEKAKETSDPKRDPEYQRMQLIADLYLNSGMTWAQISQRYGIPRTTMTDKMKKLGLWTEEMEKKRGKSSGKSSDKNNVYPDSLSDGRTGGQKPQKYISLANPPNKGGLDPPPPTSEQCRAPLKKSKIPSSLAKSLNPKPNTFKGGEEIGSGTEAISIPPKKDKGAV